MTENIPALLRSKVAKILDDRIPSEALDYEGLDGLTTEIVAALESLSAPPATDDALPERLEAQATFVPETRMADVMLEAAEVIRAARHPSPLTREALYDVIRGSLKLVDGFDYERAHYEVDPNIAADAILSRFALPEPAEVEWAVRWTGTEGEPVTDLGADESDVRALVQEQEGFAVAVKRAVGPWVPVKGAEQ